MSGETAAAAPTAPAPVPKGRFAWHHDDTAMKAILAVAMATVTLFATGVAYLQQDASIQSGVSQRAAEAIATTSMGDQASSLAKTTTDFGGFRRWFEALSAANWAAKLQADTRPSHYDDAMLGGSVAADPRTSHRGIAPSAPPQATATAGGATRWGVNRCRATT